MQKSYEFVTAKGAAVTIYANDDSITEVDYNDGWSTEHVVEQPMHIVGLLMAGQHYKAFESVVQGMRGASFVYSGKQAFVPVPLAVLDDIHAGEEAKRAALQAKEDALDAILAANEEFGRRMDHEECGL